jgi:RNA polymerase sigma-70 factor, ECF subfamily
MISDLLIEEARSSPAALNHLCRAAEDAIRGLVVSGCRDADDAADIMQDTLYIVITRLHQFRGDGTPTNWVRTIARSQLRMHYRRLRVRPHSSLTETVADQRTPDCCLRVDLDRALQRVSAHFRVVLELHDIQGRPLWEVAEMTGASLTCAKTRLRRGRAAVRRLLDRAA